MNQTYPGASGNGTQWQRFTQIVNSLNANAGLDTVYKVLFMGRHGEGFHNAAESFFGTGAWNVRQSSNAIHTTTADGFQVLLV